MVQRFTKEYYNKLSKSVELPQELKNMILNLPNKVKVLDVGCGYGNILMGIYSIRTDLQLFGIDIGDVEDFLPDYVSFLKTTAEQIDFPDNYFDVVILKMVLEHVLQPESVISDVKRVLKPQGKGYISVPYYKSIFVPDYINFWGDYTHIRPYTKKSMWRLLTDYDLSVKVLTAGIPLKMRILGTGYYFLKFLTTCKRESRQNYYNSMWTYFWGNSSLECIFEKPINPKTYKLYLNQTLNTLFRPTEDNGFWDEQENKIIRALNYEFTKEDKIVWSPDNSIKWRYAPFALMGIMQWRVSDTSTDTHDSKIKVELNYFIEKLEDKQTLSKIPSYGIGPLILSFSLAYKVFQDERYKETAWSLYEYAIKKFGFSNSEDSLLLYGWCFLYEIEKDDNLLNNITNVLEGIIKKQNEEGLFIFENPTTRRHQNQMYTLWGIGKAIEVLNRKEYLANMEKTLDYTIKHRMLNSGAFIWEDLPLLERLKSKVICKIKSVTPDWELLFECHQTFFVNAVSHYYKAEGEKNYDTHIRRAMEWIFGNNALNKDLVEISDIGVPMRMMSIKGKMGVNGQMFKGAYEIGSYMMALTNLIQLGRF